MTQDKKEKTEPWTFVIFGDLMIDRAWIIDSPTSSVSQQHRGIVPYKRVHPTNNDARLGGAGMAASLLSTKISDERHSESEIQLIGQWADADNSYISHIAKLGLPENSRQLQLLQISQGAYDTTASIIRFRYYFDFANRSARLVGRLDQDPPLQQQEDQRSNSTRDAVNALDIKTENVGVIVCDTRKGLVTEASLLALAEKLRKKNCIWIIDSKEPNILEWIPKLAGEVYFTLNRGECHRLCLQVGGKYDTDEIPTGKTYSTELISSIDLIGEKLVLRNPSARFIVKLDRDGCCLYCPKTKEIQRHSITLSINDADGVASGDMFNAQFLFELTVGGRNSQEAAREATIFATAWTQFCAEDWYQSSPRTSDLPLAKDINSASFKKIVDSCRKNAFEWIGDKDKAFLDSRRTANYKEMVMLESPGIRLCDSGGILGSFVSVNARQRRQVATLKGIVSKYASETSYSRPLNCLLVDTGVGTGRFFIEELAKASECQLMEFNCSLPYTHSEFTNAISLVQDVPIEKCPLIYFSNADASQTLLPFLVTFLWEPQIFIAGSPRPLRRRCINVLGISSQMLNGLQSNNGIDTNLSQSAKWKDIMARVNGPETNLSLDDEPTKSRTTRIYLFLQKLSEYRRVVCSIQKGLLDLIYAAPKFSYEACEYLTMNTAPPPAGFLRLQNIRLEDRVRFWHSLGYGLYDNPLCPEESIKLLNNLGYNFPVGTTHVYLNELDSIPIQVQLQ